MVSGFRLVSKSHIKCFGLQRELVASEHQNMSNKMRDRAVKRIWLEAQHAVWPSAQSFIYPTVLRCYFILFTPIFTLFYLFLVFWSDTDRRDLPVGELTRPGIFSSPDTRTFSGSRCITGSSAGCFLNTHSRCAPSAKWRRLLSAMTWNKWQGGF